MGGVTRAISLHIESPSYIEEMSMFLCRHFYSADEPLSTGARMLSIFRSKKETVYILDLKIIAYLLLFYQLFVLCSFISNSLLHII